MRGYPSRYVVIDTETKAHRDVESPNISTLKLRLGGMLIIDPVEWDDFGPVTHGFKTADEAWMPFGRMAMTRSPIYVFAHNMQFDSRIFGLWTWIASGKLSLSPPQGLHNELAYKKPLLITDENVFIVRTFRPDGQRIIFIDTVQWLSTSIKQLGEWLCNDKYMIPDDDAPESAWYDYCFQDVRILHDALLHMWSYLKGHNFDFWEATPASMTMRVFRMRFEPKSIRIPEDTSVMSLDREAYYGGYSDCFRVGKIKGPVYHIDINSMYPYVMANNRFPVEVRDHGDESFSGELPSQWHPEETTAEVHIRSTDNTYPIRGSDQTVYGTGNIRTTLCAPELSRAWGRGDIVAVGRWVRYRCADIFSRWAEYWRIARDFATERGDGIASLIVKRMSNALHGKFGQMIGEWKCVGTTPDPALFGSGRIYNSEWRRYVEYRDINGLRFERSMESEDPRSFVPIAAWTSSYGRVYMDSLIDIAGEGNTYYIATDSLLVSAKGYAALLANGLVGDGKSGHFKIEGKYKGVTIWGVNQLDLDTLKQRSGVKLGSTEIEPGVWSTERWQTCTEAIYRDGQDSVSVANTLVRPSLRYSRREVLEDGTTIPWSFDCASVSTKVIAATPVMQFLANRIQ